MRLTPAADEAWTVYRDLGPARTYTAVAKKLHKSVTLIRRWAKAHGWPARAGQYDAELEEAAKAAEAAKLRANAGIWAARFTKNREEAYMVSEELIAKAKAMLKFPVAESRTENADGGQVVIIKPGKWSFDTPSRLLDLAFKLRQLTMGGPTERFEHGFTETGKGNEGVGVPVVTFVLPKNSRDD